VRGACLPNDDVTLSHVSGWIDELEDCGLVFRYEVSEQAYVQLTGWEKHQRVDKPSKFTLPEPPNSRAFARPSRDSRETLAGPSRSDLVPTTPDLGPSTTDLRPTTMDQSPASAFDDDSIAECEYLADWIHTNGSKRPKVTKSWLEEADRLKRIDGRTHQQVMAAIDWCQKDEFWKCNVLSMSKLRAKYDQMRLSAERQKSTAKRSPGEIRAAIARGEE
jgi:hypothetical protein